jgi:hypothetical protein
MLTYANAWGYARAPNKLHVYDWIYQIAWSEFNLQSAETLGKLPFTTASLSIIGRNLWIIDKNTPYADPEAGLSSGNVQVIWCLSFY